MLNVNRLRVLREVAGRGTVVGAAEALFMTPSAVSQQLSTLVREAGTPLLERDGRRLRLTAAGERLVAHTERVLAELERASADLAASAEGVVGHVRVSAFPTAARALLVPALVRLRADHPNLRVSMVDLEPEQSMPALKAGQLDLVVTYEHDVMPMIEDPGISRERILVEPLYVALPASHPLASRSRVPLAGLAEEQWVVGHDASSLLDLVMNAAHRVGFEPKTDLHSNDFQVILAAVGAGLGVSLVPPLALVGEYPDVVLRPAAEFPLNRFVHSNIRRGSGADPKLAVVVGALRDAAR